MKKNEEIQPTYPNMKSIQAHCYFPKAVLSEAKKAGCPAFKTHTKIDTLQLIRWLNQSSANEDENVDWSQRWTKAKAEREELRLQVERGQTCTLTDACDAFARATAPLVSGIEKALVSDLPPQLEGLRAAEISARAKSEINSVIEKWRQALESEERRLSTGLASRMKQPNGEEESKTTNRKQTKITGQGGKRKNTA